ncbi:uncharacterized protein K452DRAFT_289943 [Aplosporella prunicola CBS 121167]|uniref:DUF985 domain-containing protein n=1 Tax=Aplosporella prunicola CBS 121167 TaxID=1176127 RepID=A0A6A6B5U4_9PEZI|nr:uncharacterized protein K452DRAFT_289943 [Aplosporella prunicola CBS 121167]KAF2139390.1 hypothetical protein K452DRAFT_289943 [Aplosporella prunicola CBS 121167]
MSTVAPAFPLNPTTTTENAATAALISALNMTAHPEGGYFVETDRDSLRVPNPLKDSSGDTRSASTTIFYLLTAQRSVGRWHRNKARTVHTLHKGRGRYVIIHADEVGEGKTGRARVETFVVGQDVSKGERLQWIVEGGKYKTSFLLPDEETGEESKEGLLISETVVPGFEFEDHDFLRPERLRQLVTPEQAEELAWMLRKE